MKESAAWFFDIFLSKKFLLFILFSGLAAIINIYARFLFNHVLSYIPSIIFAYCIGMVTAFTLNKYLNFRGGNKKIHFEIMNFIIINILSIIQTLLVSLLLAEVVFPSVGFFRYRYGVAHVCGVGTPVITSFLGHKYITFGSRSFMELIKSGMGKVLWIKKIR